MHLIVCVDDRYGMSFCGRRLSRDKAVYAHMLARCAGKTLWVHPTSAQLFPASSVCTAVDFLDQAKTGEYCFAETTALSEKLKDLESVTLYHWNRAYPATVKFPKKLLDAMRLVHTEDFPGNSHDKITMELYTL